jgi:phenylalanyl-tRNA synthetase beta chain
VAEVLTAERHPQADKLQVLTVDAGDGPLQVVCGAPNARAGMKGVFGAPGAYVPGSGITLKVAAIRGVESNGMMCSVRELEIGEEHDGIIELPADAPVGAAFPSYAGLDDPVIDVAINPNRPDAMGVYGIARDLCRRRPRPAEAGRGRSGERQLPVPGRDPHRGFGRLPSLLRARRPRRPQRPLARLAAARLKAVGQRPISALVDMTNYIMLTYGRPLHVYDLAKLSGAVTARKARTGETVEALNGKTYTLDETMTVIADEAGVHDIGGIMGGEHSGVTEATTDILIECAFFEPAHIARTGQKLALASDARTRLRARRRSALPRFRARHRHPHGGGAGGRRGFGRAARRPAAGAGAANRLSPRARRDARRHRRAGGPADRHPAAARLHRRAGRAVAGHHPLLAP